MLGQPAALRRGGAAVRRRLPRRPRRFFFKSMHGTLNHILVADRIWMKRFTGDGEAPAALDAILHDRFADAAHRARRRGPAHRGLCRRPDEARRAVHPLPPRPPRRGFEQPLAPALDHWFNHQTHHRGQAHTILTGAASRLHPSHATVRTGPYTAAR